MDKKHLLVNCQKKTTTTKTTAEELVEKSNRFMQIHTKATAAGHHEKLTKTTKERQRDRETETKTKNMENLLNYV